MSHEITGLKDKTDYAVTPRSSQECRFQARGPPFVAISLWAGERGRDEGRGISDH
jgi:hypothetical protein